METIYKFPLRVDTNQIKLKVSQKEFGQLCEDNSEMQLELTSAGIVVTMQPLRSRVLSYSTNLSAQVRFWNLGAKYGEVLDTFESFALPNGAIRTANLAWITHYKLENINYGADYPVVVPDFIIEFKSRSDGNSLSTVQEKMIEYRENGVRLGWLVNLENNEVEIHRFGKEVEILQSPKRLSGEDVLQELTVDLSKILQ